MPLRVFNTLTNQKQDFAPVAAGPHRHLRLRAHRLRPGPHRQRAHVHRVRRGRALPALPRLRGEATSATSPTSTTRSSTRAQGAARTPPRSPRTSSSEFRARRAGADTCSRRTSSPRSPSTSRRSSRIIGELIERGRRLRVAGRRLLRGRAVPGATRKLSQAQPRRPRRRARGWSRASRSASRSTSRSGRPPSPASRRGRARGAGPAGLAHRVLGDVRSKYLGETFDIHGGGAGPDLPPPRERDRPERGGERQDVRALLDAQRLPRPRGREDVARAWATSCACATRSQQVDAEALRVLLPLHALPQAAELHRASRSPTPRARWSTSTRRWPRRDAFLVAKKFRGEPSPGQARAVVPRGHGGRLQHGRGHGAAGARLRPAQRAHRRERKARGGGGAPAHGADAVARARAVVARPGGRDPRAARSRGLPQGHRSGLCAGAHLRPARGAQAAGFRPRRRHPRGGRGARSGVAHGPAGTDWRVLL